MRENRPSGSEGGATELNRSLLPLSRRQHGYEWRPLRQGTRAVRQHGYGAPARLRSARPSCVREPKTLGTKHVGRDFSGEHRVRQHPNPYSKQ